jgi:hypothetical protein
MNFLRDRVDDAHGHERRGVAPAWSCAGDEVHAARGPNYRSLWPKWRLSRSGDCGARTLTEIAHRVRLRVILAATTEKIPRTNPVAAPIIGPPTAMRSLG